MRFTFELLTKKKQTNKKKRNERNQAHKRYKFSHQFNLLYFYLKTKNALEIILSYLIILIIFY